MQSKRLSNQRFAALSKGRLKNAALAPAAHLIPQQTFEANRHLIKRPLHNVREIPALPGGTTSCASNPAGELLPLADSRKPKKRGSCFLCVTLR